MNCDAANSGNRLARRIVVGIGFVATLLFAANAIAADNWFLAIGHGGHRMLSRDGLKWERHQEWSIPGHNQDDLNVAVNFRGTFFAGGGYYSGRTTATRDGETWSDGVVPGSSPIFGYQVFGDTLYAVDLRGKVFKTSDGENWTLVARAEMPTPTHWIRGTDQGNGLIIGSGDFGPVIAFDPKTEKITVTQMAGQVDKNPGLRRVAFGNGIFVIGGQAGLLAVTKDGISFQNNEVKPERGDIQCVVWTGKEFLATTKTESYRSANGLDWQPVGKTLPRQIRRVEDWLYGYSWPPHKISRSQDGIQWEPVPNEKEWQAKSYAYGPLAGGPPPKLPAAPPKPKTPASPAPATNKQSSVNSVSQPLVAAAERIAQRVVDENKHERNYRFDLTMEGLLEISEVTGKPRYRNHVMNIMARRGWTPATDVSFNEQSFTCLTFALYRATEDRDWLTVFLRQSDRCRKEKSRSPERAVMHPRGRERGGGYAMLLDDMQEFVARMARAGRYSGDATFYGEAVEQLRIYRQVVRDEKTGLWHQGRGWLGDRPEQVSPGFWSRGHGWLLRGISNAATEIPRDRVEFAEVQKTFTEIADALLVRQQPSGMWHCLLDQSPDKTPAESSGTAMIATALSRGYRIGVLTDGRYRDAASRAFAALPSYIDTDGQVLSTSPGPGPLESEEKYFVSSFPAGNDHGTFALLFAAAESVRFDQHVKKQ